MLTLVSGAKDEHVKVDEILRMAYPMAQTQRDAPKPPSWGSRCRLRYQRSAIARTDGLLGVARAEIAALYRE